MMGYTNMFRQLEDQLVLSMMDYKLMAPIPSRSTLEFLVKQLAELCHNCCILHTLCRLFSNYRMQYLQRCLNCTLAMCLLLVECFEFSIHRLSMIQRRS